MQDWKTYKLGDVADVQNGYAFKSGEMGENGIPILKIKNIVPPNVILEGAGYYTGEINNKLKKFIVKNGDFLIAMTGSTVNVMSSAVGKMGKYRLNDIALLNQRAGKIFITNTEKANFEYVCHFLNRYEIHYNLALNATGSANQANISPSQIKDIEIILPPLQEQKAIASILSALDDKIELNLQMNKTLEEMAMALYKHWFVDFGPFQNGKVVESELGMIPEGWEVKRLEEFVTLTMGQSPKSEFYNDDQQGFPFHQGVSDYGIRFPNDKTYSLSGSRQAFEGDILFSVRAPVGRLNIAKNIIILGRGLASMRMKESNNFFYYALKTMFSSEDIIGSGTVFNSVNKVELQNLKFIIPSKTVLNEFQIKVESLDSMYFINSMNNQTLTTLRDTLLPKLISGEVRVKDIEQMVAAAL